MNFVNRKTIIPLIIIISLLFLIRNILASIMTVEQNSRILTNLVEEESEAKRRNQFLKERLHYVQTDEFIEKEAREKLGMVKEREHIVLIPPVKEEIKSKQEKEKLPNWEKWKKLFF